VHSPQDNLLSLLLLETDVTDAILGASGLWRGTWTGAGGTATLTESFFSHSPWLHGQQQYYRSFNSMEALINKVMFYKNDNFFWIT
jgi:hypothetical protein